MLFESAMHTFYLYRLAFIICVFPIPIKLLSTSLPDKQSFASCAPSLGWHALQYYALLSTPDAQVQQQHFVCNHG